MADEPDNLVLDILRKIQGDIAGIKRLQDDHTVRLVFMADEMLLLRSATVGFLREAEEARVDRGHHKNWMAVLEHRAGRLEGAH